MTRKQHFDNIHLVNIVSTIFNIIIVNCTTLQTDSVLKHKIDKYCHSHLTVDSKKMPYIHIIQCPVHYHHHHVFILVTDHTPTKAISLYTLYVYHLDVT